MNPHPLRGTSVSSSYLMLPINVNQLMPSERSDPLPRECDQASIPQENTEVEEDGLSITHAIPIRILPALAPNQREYIFLRSGAILTNTEFCRIRRVLGAWILTNEPARIRHVLGLAQDEAGIKTEWL